MMTMYGGGGGEDIMEEGHDLTSILPPVKHLLRGKGSEG